MCHVILVTPSPDFHQAEVLDGPLPEDQEIDVLFEGTPDECAQYAREFNTCPPAAPLQPGLNSGPEVGAYRHARAIGW